MKRLVPRLALPLALLLAFAALTACGAPATTVSPVATTTTTTATSVPTTTFQAVNLNAAGATFPAPLYTKWFDEYAKITGAKINYQPIGSGGGITQITEGTVDFGASDSIMTTEQQSRAEAAHGPILHVPMTSGAVAIAFNLPGISKERLKLSGEVLADIYLKKITRWNDSSITDLNPGLNLPNIAIAVVHRSDGSGTTYIFTNYLSKISAEWKDKVGNATSVNWPGDIGGPGNAGVAGQVQQTPGAIGYVELAYALQNNIAYANLRNAPGNYLPPTLASTTKAAEGVALPDDMKVMLTDSSNSDAYPIVGLTWLLVYADQTDKAKGETLVNMLWWALHDGQKFAEPLNYAPLAAAAVTKAENQVASIKFQGQPILKR